MAPLIKNINQIVDSMSRSFPKEYPVNFYTVMHQRKHGRDYIKVSTAEFFNKDSLSRSYLYNGETVVLYSKKFFKIRKDQFIIDKALEYKSTTIPMYHPKYTIFEINDKEFVNISMEDAYKKNLFNYSDYKVLEPKPKNK